MTFTPSAYHNYIIDFGSICNYAIGIFTSFAPLKKVLN